MKNSEQSGNQPQKVGYLKYLRLQKKELGVNHTLDDYIAFTRKYQPCGLLHFLHYLPHWISSRIDRYKIEHLKLGKQKWRNGKLYIEKIPYFVSSEATMYLTAILRDYLRAFAKNTYAIGNALFEKDGEENNCFRIRAVSSEEEEQGEAYVLVGYHRVDYVCGLVRVGFRALLASGLVQRAVYYAVFGVHYGGFAVFLGFAHYEFGAAVARSHYFLAVGQGLDEFFYLSVFFKQL